MKVSAIILFLLASPFYAGAVSDSDSISNEDKIELLESKYTKAIETEKRLLADSLSDEMAVYDSLADCLCVNTRKLLVNNINGLLILSTYVMENEYPVSARLLTLDVLDRFKSFKRRHPDIQWTFFGQGSLDKFLANLPDKDLLSGQVTQ